MSDANGKVKSYHVHVDEDGALIKCYHKTKNLVSSTEFWVGITLSYPLEHWLWEHVWPFNIITGWLH